MLTTYDVIVVGAGVFGATAALSLRRRGHKVAVLDPGPIPHPRAASTDISKVVRLEYGADERYMAMIEDALPGWQAWNDAWGETLYHNTGVTMLTRQPMEPEGFEFESYQRLLQRNHQPIRLNGDDIARRFPAWKPGAFVDGFFHDQGGYVESGRVVSRLIAEAQEAGVTLYAGQRVTELVGDEGPDTAVSGVRTESGQIFNAGQVLLAVGAWTPVMLPELAPVMRVTGHPVFHLKPPDPALFKPPHFTVFGADVNRTGWYGFPFHPREEVIKVANHGVGQELHPVHDKRVVDDADIRNLRSFLADTFPALQDAAISYTRRCLYCDTLDEHLWIDRHPTRPGLSVAAGGSGHGFKFAPILGDLIADAVEGVSNPYLDRFRWRELGPDAEGQEASRYHGE